MKKNLLIISLAAGILFMFSCKKDKPNPEPQKLIETISGVISKDLTLNPNITYFLKGRVFVKENATLTIPAGVTVEVEKVDDPLAKGALIITKGSKLNVNGTSNLPVIFTSAAASKSAGDWIGIILLGKAPTNLPNAHIKGLDESGDTEFGGTEPNDNSGSLKYLRLEYAGGLNPAMEVEWELDMASGLSLESVGSGTSMDHIMVSNSRDDGFQFVGGTVNAKYLIAYNNGDDNFDFDRGFTGKLQFLLAYHSVPSTVAIRANGMESLNDKDASNITPYTRPVISNFTIIGPDGINTDLSNQSQGIYIRRNTRFLVRNSIIAGYSNGGLMMCPKTKPILLNNAGSQFKFNLVNSDIASRTFTYDDGPTGVNIIPDPQVALYAVETENIEKPAINKNEIISPIGELKLKSLNSLTAHDFSPMQESKALIGADFADPEYSDFFDIVSFRGAVGADNWTMSAWTNWK